VMSLKHLGDLRWKAPMSFQNNEESMPVRFDRLTFKQFSFASQSAIISISIPPSEDEDCSFFCKFYSVSLIHFNPWIILAG
jgi:hypothetical protein